MVSEEGGRRKQVYGIYLNEISRKKAFFPS
jgi:hypothetical protein